MPKLFRSKNAKKKYSFLYDNDRSPKGYSIINFGAVGYGDYPYWYKVKGKAYADRKKRAYIARHRVNQDWTKINAGALSRWILWNKPTVEESFKDFLKKFDL